MYSETHEIHLREAKRAETQSRWEDAANIWAKIGRTEDAGACLLLADAIRQGDEYRARVAKELGAEPDKSENPRAWVKWYDGMTAIYKEMFNRKNI